MQYNNRYRNNPKNQATLFDQFFADQFSEASSYDIDIDWHNDEDNDYSAGKRDRGKRHPREEGGEAPRLHRTGGEAPCSMKGRKT